MSPPSSTRSAANDCWGAAARRPTGELRSNERPYPTAPPFRRQQQNPAAPTRPVAGTAPTWTRTPAFLHDPFRLSPEGRGLRAALSPDVGVAAGLPLSLS